jgi:glucose-1-phosphate cytidylyltransferase
MKVVIFAGGLGTRISEETTLKPKPMVEIGGKPILWHIMKIYEHYGFTDFVICLGYKGQLIKEYFLNYHLYNSNLTVDLANNSLEIHATKSEPFKVTLVDTGLETNTAGRLKRIQPYVQGETFMLTYGDGVANINILDLLKFHKQHGKTATLSTIKLPSRFGNLQMAENGQVLKFEEKSTDDGIWINGGFFVLNPDVFEFLEGDMDTIQWERQPLGAIANAGKLMAYKHHGFWKCMDAMRDKTELEEMWSTGDAEWKVWK